MDLDRILCAVAEEPVMKPNADAVKINSNDLLINEDTPISKRNVNEKSENRYPLPVGNLPIGLMLICAASNYIETGMDKKPAEEFWKCTTTDEDGNVVETMDRMLQAVQMTTRNTENRFSGTKDEIEKMEIKDALWNAFINSDKCFKLDPIHEQTNNSSNELPLRKKKEQNEDRRRAAWTRKDNEVFFFLTNLFPGLCDIRMRQLLSICFKSSRSYSQCSNHYRVLKRDKTFPRLTKVCTKDQRSQKTKRTIVSTKATTSSERESMPNSKSAHASSSTPNITSNRSGKLSLNNANM